MVNLYNINGFCYELLIKIQLTAYLLLKHGFMYVKIYIKTMFS